ncbi:hypothetical protein CDAR_525411 [Caerostris darwini]|uniref:Uncharacterized protein n=1 Tax=Caerostris darwini TaxID=1538125 RepID=A0AAV4RK93_9ARAC|nr:hypothetical protein CDAR_525411 [Caerostris darwini]
MNMNCLAVCEDTQERKGPFYLLARGPGSRGGKIYLSGEPHHGTPPHPGGPPFRVSQKARPSFAKTSPEINIFERTVSRKHNLRPTYERMLWMLFLALRTRKSDNFF